MNRCLLFFIGFCLNINLYSQNSNLTYELNPSPYFMDMGTGCLDADFGQYPVDTFYPICIGVIQDITPMGWAGEYSKVNVTEGTEYIFSSSVSTDYITIGNNNGDEVLVTGTGSVTWISDINGTIRFYTHLDSSCAGSNTTSRARRVQCGDELPTPINDECEDAIALSCGDTGEGQTYSANDSGGNPSRDVFFTYTGDGTPKYVTMSLCGSSYSTFIHVYSDCSLTNEIAYSHYGCGDNYGSLVSFASDGVSTYIILVEGYDEEYFGNFTYELSCSNVPSPPEDCDEFEVLSNGFNYYFGVFGDLATDLPIGDNSVTAYGMKPNLISDIGIVATVVNFLFYDDNSGVPGNQISSRTGTILDSEPMGTIDGNFQIKEYTVIFDTPMEFNPNTRYWVEIDTDAIGWELSSDYGSLGLPDVERDFFTGQWTPIVNPQVNYVFDLICNELNVNDLNEFEFLYYPNPVKDFLNIVSSEKVLAASIYNLAGQKLNHPAFSLTEDQIDLTSLASGTYIFRLVLGNGQVETFRIFKQ